MPPRTQIRLVRPEEHLELREVRLSALAYSPLLAEHHEQERAAPVEFWRERAAQRAEAIESATFVADDDGTFVGVADGFLSEDGKTVEIGGMWVSPEKRRSGIGDDPASRGLWLGAGTWSRAGRVMGACGQQPSASALRGRGLRRRAYVE